MQNVREGDGPLGIILLMAVIVFVGYVCLHWYVVQRFFRNNRPMIRNWMRKLRIPALVIGMLFLAYCMVIRPFVTILVVVLFSGSVLALHNMHQKAFFNKRVAQRYHRAPKYPSGK